MTFRERVVRWSATLSAGVVGGTAGISAWWASLPVELRSLLVAALVGLAGELWQVFKTALRARAARALGLAPETAALTLHPQSYGERAEQFAHDERQLEREPDVADGQRREGDDVR